MSLPAYAAFLFLNLACGVLPSLGFFAWVERNTALPWLPLWLDWPWVTLPADSIALRTAWNFGSILAFGFLHSLFAQPGVHRLLQRVFPAQAIRSVYLAITGLALIAVMGCWQHTGIVLWALPLSWKWLNALSLLLFWGLMIGTMRVVSRFDALSFLGIRQLAQPASELERTEGMPELCETGLYAWVRHPLYSFTSLALVCAPLMTLDRAIVCAACLAYLAAGIPIEERKLIRQFGPAYETYRKRVPAILPLRRPG